MIKVNSSSYLWRQWKTMVYNFLSTVYIMVYNCQTFKECSNSSHPWRHSVDKWISLYSLWISWYIISIHGVHHGMHLSDFFKECSNSSSYLWRQWKTMENIISIHGYRDDQSEIITSLETMENIISIHGYRDDQSEIITSLETIGRQMNIIVFTLDIVEYNFNPRRTSWYATVRLSRNVIHHHISGDNR